jgi:hypothetical protein
MRLYHEDDVAIKLIEDRSEIEMSLTLRDQEGIPSSSKGKVILSGSKSEEIGINPGDDIYFDPRGVCHIKELGLYVMSHKNILLED